MELERAAPTPLTLTLMISLQILASSHFLLELGDVSTAFMQSERLQRDQGALYASPLPERWPGVPPGCLVELLTAVYGLLNAPAHSRRTLRQALVDLGYRQSSLDPCLSFLPPAKEDKNPSPA